MKYSTRIFLTAGIFVLGLFAGLSTSIKAQDKDEQIRIDTNLVLVDVLVRDKKGLIVKGLKADQFEVVNDGVKQPIDNFSAEDASVSFGIIYDMHPTTEESTKAVLASLKQFSQELGKRDDVFLIAFNMRGQQTFDFIPDLDQLERHMQRPEKSEPHSLYEAVYYASEKIQTKQNQKKVLLIISDSADHRSKNTLSDVRNKLTKIRTEAYAVVFDDWNDFRYSDIAHDGKRTRAFSEASPLDRVAITDLTSDSGGSTFFDGSQNALQLLKIYEQISQEIRSHYTLGFYPETDDTNRHDIRVKLKGVDNSKGWTLSYRMSYQMQGKPAAK